MNHEETIEHLLMNKKTGEICPGLRIKLMDRAHTESIGAFEGKYEVSLSSTEPDGWLVYSGQGEGSNIGEGPWIYVAEKLISKSCEDLGSI